MIFAFAIGAPLFGEWVYVGIADAVSVSVDFRLGVSCLGLGSIAVAPSAIPGSFGAVASLAVGLRRRERWRLALPASVLF